MDRPLKLQSRDKESNLIGGVYDHQTNRLSVQLRDRHYALHNVPTDLIEQMELSEKPGEFFTKHIKPHHEFTRVK